MPPYQHTGLAVPFYRLPDLQTLIKDDCPSAYRGVGAAWAEIIPTLIRQRREPVYFIERRLPPHTRPVMPVAAD
jgi:fatty acid desaturase